MALALLVSSTGPATAEPAGIAALVYPMFSPDL
jgi:hypothetical protein